MSKQPLSNVRSLGSQDITTPHALSLLANRSFIGSGSLVIGVMACGGLERVDNVVEGRPETLLRWKAEREGIIR